jgi:hypothetical protein
MKTERLRTIEILNGYLVINQIIIVSVGFYFNVFIVNDKIILLDHALIKQYKDSQFHLELNDADEKDTVCHYVSGKNDNIPITIFDCQT